MPGFVLPDAETPISEPILDVDQLTHRLGGPDSAPVLRDVHLRIDSAQLLALAGRSGSGKSTLCHLVAGLGSPGAGRILVAGRVAGEISDWAVVSLLPQRLALVGELSVRENILLPTMLAHRAETAARSEGAGGMDGEALIEALGLSPVAGRAAGQTSLGEQQRAALARALVLRPRLAVLDEPTGHQDDAHVDLVLQVLASARRAGTAVLVATHDDRVLDIADRVVRLRLGQVVPPD